MNIFKQIRSFPEKSAEKRRVIIIARPLDNQKAGVHTYTKGFIQSLHQQKEENFEIVLIRESDAGEYPDFKTILLPHIDFVPAYQLVHIFLIIPLICRLLKADIVVEMAHYGPFNLPFWFQRITVIYDLTPILFPHYHPFSNAFFHKLFLARALRKADSIIAISSHTRNDIIKKYFFAKNKVHVVYPGLTAGFFPFYDDSILKGYHVNRPFFLYVGTIEPRKNLILLLKAFERYHLTVNSAVKLVIVGAKGWKSSSLYEYLNRSKARGNIVFTDYVLQDHLKIFYSSAKALIYPSLYEGFGLPVIEAMACGSPCIIADNSSLKEIGASFAVLFKTNDEQDLFDKMINLNENINMDKSIAYANSFQWEKSCNRFIQLLKNLELKLNE